MESEIVNVAGTKNISGSTCEVMEKYMSMLRRSIMDLSDIMSLSIKERVRDIAKTAIGRSVRTKDPMFWHAGLLMLGLVEARKKLREFSGIKAEESKEDKTEKEPYYESLKSDVSEFKKLIDEIDIAVLSHLKLWKKQYGGRIEYIDDALSGVALIRLYEQIATEENAVNYGESERSAKTELKSACKDAIDTIYKFVIASPRDDRGSIVYNASKSANIFADGVGQASMFLAAYGRYFNESEALGISRSQLLNFKKYGMDDRSKLPYHGYLVEEGKVIKKGVLSWGRAAGWLIMGLSEYVISEDKESEIYLWYEELSKILLTYRRDDGGFSWQVQATDGPLDTSATGMIIYGLVNRGDNADGYLQMSAVIKKMFCDNIVEGKVINVLSSCDDFGVHYQTYGHYPWGQGAILLAFSRIL